MRIIFSRKGFDSTAGGVASPIFPSGKVISLPIPVFGDNESFHTYDEITIGDSCLGPIVSELTNNKISGGHFLHLDPDLYPESVKRPDGWRPIFGQAGSAEAHLQNQGVGPGDIFLFYGWFNQLVPDVRPYRYAKQDQGMHVIFGWLQVDQHLPVRKREEIPDWASKHQHCLRTPHDKKDFIYTSTPRLKVDSVLRDVPGGGVFKRYNDALCLSETKQPSNTRSTWELPLWFHSSGRRHLSYHSRDSQWEEKGKHVLLQTVGRGQEFVLDCDEYPEAIKWLAGILSLAA